jgi:hypothetical protein
MQMKPFDDSDSYNTSHSAEAQSIPKHVDQEMISINNEFMCPVISLDGVYSIA